MVVSDAEGPAVGPCVSLLSVTLKCRDNYQGWCSSTFRPTWLYHFTKADGTEPVSEITLGHWTAFSGRISEITVRETF